MRTCSYLIKDPNSDPDDVVFQERVGSQLFCSSFLNSPAHNSVSGVQHYFNIQLATKIVHRCKCLPFNVALWLRDIDSWDKLGHSTPTLRSIPSVNECSCLYLLTFPLFSAFVKLQYPPSVFRNASCILYVCKNVMFQIYSRSGILFYLERSENNERNTKKVKVKMLLATWRPCALIL